MDDPTIGDSERPGRGDKRRAKGDGFVVAKTGYQDEALTSNCHRSEKRIDQAARELVAKMKELGVHIDSGSNL